MLTGTLLKLAQELEWVGVELEFYGKQHALAGFPEGGPTWDTFLEKQRGVFATADKIERELKGLVRFNPTTLMKGIDFPLAATFESIGELLSAVEEIKQSSQSAVHELPSRVRDFTKRVNNYLATGNSLAG